MWVCHLKDEKRRIYYSKKEDATVKAPVLRVSVVRVTILRIIVLRVTVTEFGPFWTYQILNLIEILSKAIFKMKSILKKKLKTVKTYMNFRFISSYSPCTWPSPYMGYYIWANKIFTYSFLVPLTSVLHQQHCHDEIVSC